MPTITINREVLDEIIGKKLSDETLKDRISMLGTDLENMDKKEITVEIFPNRPDMLSEQGFGRALSSFIGVKTGLRNYKVKSSGERVIVSKELKKVRPFTVCAIIKDLNLDSEKVREIIHVQEKLHLTFCRRRKKAAIGIYPLEKIRMPIRFEARAPEDIVFQPLAYSREINAKQILQIHPVGKKYAHLVSSLDKYAVFVDADEHILSFTPIINSHLTGKVSERTKEAFVEVSGFDLVTADYVLSILMAAFADMGASIYSIDVVYPDKVITTPNLEPTIMHFELREINGWLGISLQEKEVRQLLSRMGYGYVKGSALVPAYRPDVIHWTDIAEDVAIAYGYERFAPAIPHKATTGQEDPFSRFCDKITTLLVGLNMLETSTYHLSSQENEFEKMLLKPMKAVFIANSKSEDYRILRWWMLPSLLQILSQNTHHEYPQDLFEAGTVFRKDNSETGVQEICRLACVRSFKEADYTKARQVLDYLLSSIGLMPKIAETEHDSFIPGRVASCIVEGEKIAYLGEIHPEVLSNFQIEMPVCCFELDLSKLYSLM